MKENLRTGRNVLDRLILKGIHHRRQSRLLLLCRRRRCRGRRRRRCRRHRRRGRHRRHCRLLPPEKFMLAQIFFSSEGQMFPVKNLFAPQGLLNYLQR